MTHPNPDDVADNMRRMIAQGDLRPFIERLARAMSLPPTDDALQQLANDDPHKWANMVHTLARLSGYSEKREVHVGVTVDVHTLSDSQLQERIQRALQSKQLAPLQLEATDVTPIDATNDNEEAKP